MAIRSMWHRLVLVLAVLQVGCEGWRGDVGSWSNPRFLSAPTGNKTSTTTSSTAATHPTTNATTRGNNAKTLLHHAKASNATTSGGNSTKATKHTPEPIVHSKYVPGSNYTNTSSPYPNAYGDDDSTDSGDAGGGSVPVSLGTKSDDDDKAEDDDTSGNDDDYVKAYLANSTMNATPFVFPRERSPPPQWIFFIIGICLGCAFVLCWRTAQKQKLRSEYNEIPTLIV